jgi:hypothetical protein
MGMEKLIFANSTHFLVSLIVNYVALLKNANVVVFAVAIFAYVMYLVLFIIAFMVKLWRKMKRILMKKISIKMKMK